MRWHSFGPLCLESENGIWRVYKRASRLKTEYALMAKKPDGVWQMCVKGETAKAMQSLAEECDEQAT